MADNPERDLWQTVLLQAFMQATAVPDPTARSASIETREAHAWIKRGGRDYRYVCALAGIDADFLRDAYLGGRMRGEFLRADPSMVRPANGKTNAERIAAARAARRGAA